MTGVEGSVRFASPGGPGLRLARDARLLRVGMERPTAATARRWPGWVGGGKARPQLVRPAGSWLDHPVLETPAGNVGRIILGLRYRLGGTSPAPRPRWGRRRVRAPPTRPVLSPRTPMDRAPPPHSRSVSFLARFLSVLQKHAFSCRLSVGLRVAIALSGMAPTRSAGGEGLPGAPVSEETLIVDGLSQLSHGAAWLGVVRMAHTCRTIRGERSRRGVQ